MANAEQKFKESKLQVEINGKLVAIEQIKSERGDFYANTLVIPAKDTLSNPKRIVVYSQMPIGPEESVVDSTFYLRSSFKNRNGRWFNTLSLWNEPAN